MVDRLETSFSPESRVGQLWEDIQRENQARGNSLAWLERQVNQGYVSDPFGLRQYKNLTDKIEGPEVLEWCYASRSCLPLLRKNKFPVFFSLSDGNDQNWLDDQKRHEIHRAVDALKKERQGKLELARGIFGWSLKKLRFNDDCSLEAEAWMAALSDCGYCSESTSLMYSIYQYAGLKPALYLEEDWTPGLKWVDRYFRKPGQEGHVLLGLPAGKGKVLFVDRINREFDGSHPLAEPLTPFTYNAGLLGSNHLNDLKKLGETGSLQGISELLAEMLPEDPHVRINLAMYYKGKGDEAAFQRTWDLASRTLSTHPLLPILQALIDASDGDTFLRSLQEEDSTLRQALKKIEASHPDFADDAHLMLANMLGGSILSDWEGLKKRATVLNADAREEMFRQFSAHALAIFRLYGRALHLNPNKVNAWMEMLHLVETLQELPGLLAAFGQETETLLAVHPGHAPLHYLAGRSYVLATNQSKNPEKNRELAKKVRVHWEAAIWEEPGHSRLNLGLASVYHVAKDWEAMRLAMERVRLSDISSGVEEYYTMKLGYHFSVKNMEALVAEARGLIADRPEDGLDILISFLRKTVFSPEGISSVDELKRRHEVFGFQAYQALLKELEKYPRARLATEEMKARMVVAWAFTGGPERLEQVFAEISQPSHSANMKGYAEGLKAIDQWLTKSYKNEPLADWSVATLEALQSVLPEGLEEQFVSIYVELINNYVYLKNYDKAARLFKKMLTLDITLAIFMYANRVINLRYPSIEQHVAGLDILFDEREKVAPELLQSVLRVYETLLSHAQDDALKKKIASRIKSLK